MNPGRKLRVFLIAIIYSILFTSSVRSQCMTGNYTIGSGMMYTTIHNAILDLKQNGVCGPVTFQIKDGLYFVTDTIPSIVGTSALNTITFTSMSGDSSQVVLDKSLPGPDINFRLNGADYIRFTHITLLATLDFINGADYNEISNCILTSGQAIRSFNNTRDEYNKIHHNRMTNLTPAGYPVINLNGDNIVLESGNEVAHNIINGNVAAINQAGMIIDHNIFDYSNIAGNGFIASCNDASYYTISNNIVKGKAGGGIMINSFSSAVNPTLIFNNMIQAGDSSSINGPVKGIYLANGHFQLYNNSVNMIAIPYSAALWLDSTWPPFCDLKNNCFINSAGGIAALFTEWLFPYYCSADYNIYYSTGDTLIRTRLPGSNQTLDFNTITDWNSYINLDSNSINRDPFFTSPVDLHANGTAALSNGTYLIQQDIDGDTRSNPPCIGADEYLQATVHYVWPGDCNNDLIVNNQDFLNVALAFMDTGSWRDPITNLWAPWRSQNWQNSFVNGTNHKYADSNGDGAVEMIDTIAINQNYSLTHPLRTATIESISSNDLKLVAVNDTVGLNSVIEFDLMAGNSTFPVTDLLGLSFSILFDNNAIDSSQVGLDYSNTILGIYNGNVYSFGKNLPGGRFDAALARIDHTDAVNINGALARLKFRVNTQQQNSGFVYATLTDVFAINAAEDTVLFDLFSDSVYYDVLLNTLNNSAVPDLFNLLWKANSNTAVIDYSGMKDTYNIKIFTAGGALLRFFTCSDEQTILDLNDINSGIFFIELSDEINKTIRKIAVFK